MVIDENVKGVSFDPDDEYEYTVSAKRKHKEDYRPFSMAAPFKHKNARRTEMDLIEILITLPKAAIIIFNDLKNNRCPNQNIVTMGEWEALDAGKLRPIYRYLNDLVKAGLIVKVIAIREVLGKPPKFTYMINPYIIKPWEYNKAKETWKLLGGNPL